MDSSILKLMFRHKPALGGVGSLTISMLVSGGVMVDHRYILRIPYHVWCAIETLIVSVCSEATSDNEVDAGLVIDMK